MCIPLNTTMWMHCVCVHSTQWLLFFVSLYIYIYLYNRLLNCPTVNCFQSTVSKSYVCAKTIANSPFNNWMMGKFTGLPLKIWANTCFWMIFSLLPIHWIQNSQFFWFSSNPIIKHVLLDDRNLSINYIEILPYHRCCGYVFPLTSKDLGHTEWLPR